MEDALKGLTEGRIVHYVMPNGAHRPAIVVNTVAGGPHRHVALARKGVRA